MQRFRGRGEGRHWLEAECRVMAQVAESAGCQCGACGSGSHLGLHFVGLEGLRLLGWARRRVGSQQKICTVPWVGMDVLSENRLRVLGQPADASKRLGSGVPSERQHVVMEGAPSPASVGRACPSRGPWAGVGAASQSPAMLSTCSVLRAASIACGACLLRLYANTQGTAC